MCPISQVGDAPQKICLSSELEFTIELIYDSLLCQQSCSYYYIHTIMLIKFHSSSIASIRSIDTPNAEEKKCHFQISDKPTIMSSVNLNKNEDVLQISVHHLSYEYLREE